jgi:PASTA domain
VSSDTQVTAVAPPSTTPGPVDTSVTTAAGMTPASAADQFTYTACVVPKLTGKKLKAARKRLRKTGCKLGKVKGRKGRSVKIRSQSPKAGKVLLPGSKVNVKAG